MPLLAISDEEWGLANKYFADPNNLKKVKMRKKDQPGYPVKPLPSDNDYEAKMAQYNKNKKKFHSFIRVKIGEEPSGQPKYGIYALANGEYLGEGANGKVKVAQSRDNKIFAIKIMKRANKKENAETAISELLGRFHKEAERRNFKEEANIALMEAMDKRMRLADLKKDLKKAKEQKNEKEEKARTAAGALAALQSQPGFNKDLSKDSTYLALVSKLELADKEANEAVAAEAKAAKALQNAYAQAKALKPKSSSETNEKPDEVIEKAEHDKIYQLLSFIEGEELAKKLYTNPEERTGKTKLYSQREKLIIAIRACLSIQELHDKNILHGDIKPENFMINGQGDQITITSIDFDTSLILAEGQTSAQIKKPVGTKDYQAPHFKTAAKSYTFSAADDIYSLGQFLDKDLGLNPDLCAKMKAENPNDRPPLNEVLLKLGRELEQCGRDSKLTDEEENLVMKAKTYDLKPIMKKNVIDVNQTYLKARALQKQGYIVQIKIPPNLQLKPNEQERLRHWLPDVPSLARESSDALIATRSPSSGNVMKGSTTESYARFDNESEPDSEFDPEKVLTRSRSNLYGYALDTEQHRKDRNKATTEAPSSSRDIPPPKPPRR